MSKTNIVQESLLAKMCESIWPDEVLCPEEKHLKKKWFVRNGQDTMKSEKFEVPVLVVVVENVKKKNISFGPIIQAGISPFTTGKGKMKEKHEALNFLSLSKESGFQSVLLDPRDYDMEATMNFKDDVVSREVVASSEVRAFNNNWFQRFVATSKEELLPIVQAEYEKRKGAPWRNPLKLKIRTTVTEKSASTTPSSSTARGSTVQGPSDLGHSQATPAAPPVAPVDTTVADPVDAVPAMTTDVISGPAGLLAVEPAVEDVEGPAPPNMVAPTAPQNQLEEPPIHPAKSLAIVPVIEQAGATGSVLQ